jgi:hypothetical protein
MYTCLFGTIRALQFFFLKPTNRYVCCAGDSDLSIAKRFGFWERKSFLTQALVNMDLHPAIRCNQI